jgi:hypothetical protein
MRGYPSVYEFPGVDLTATAITTDFTTTSASNSLITITTSTAHGITAGQAINITGLSSATTGFSRADGNFIVFDVPVGGTTLRYFANGVVGTSSGQSLYTDFTLLKRGNLYTGASLATTTTTSNGANPSVITVNFSSNHGLVPNCPIYCSMAGGTNPLLASGQFIVSSVPSLTSIVFTARTGGIVTPGTASIFALSNKSQLSGFTVVKISFLFGTHISGLPKKYCFFLSILSILFIFLMDICCFNILMIYIAYTCSVI